MGCNRFHYAKNAVQSACNRLHIPHRNRFLSRAECTRGGNAMIQKPATISDVAKAAQVSTATVSRALSNPNQVSDRTREAVLEAIEHTGYRVNLAARNLRMQRAGRGADPCPEPRQTVLFGNSGRNLGRVRRDGLRGADYGHRKPAPERRGACRLLCGRAGGWRDLA